MAEIIDLTVSPRPEITEISSDSESYNHNRAQENKKRKRKRGKTSNGPASDSGITAQPSRAHSLDVGNRHDVNDSSTVPHPQLASQALQSTSSRTVDEPGLFFFDAATPPILRKDILSTLEPTASNRDGDNLLLPPHVVIFHDNEPVPADVIPPPKPSSDDEEYIEYLDYEDRKAPGSLRYFEVEGEEANQSKPSIFKCKNCGAESDHKTYECPIQICLTCGARDEHSTRSCPISKTCYTCGMKGHINKTCPNRFSANVSSSNHPDCDRCGSAEHKMNECPTLWRIYQYVNDEERILIVQSREQKKLLAIGEGGEGYISKEVWCYNCGTMGHLGDDCDELPHPATFPAESSAFSSNNVMSGPFYDPATEPLSMERTTRVRGGRDEWSRLADDWDAKAPPIDVGKRGKKKDKEKLEKRFREQEDGEEDWFNDTRNMRTRGMGQQVPPPGPRGKTLKVTKDGGYDRSPPPSSLSAGASGRSLLERLSDARGERDRGKGDRGREPSQQSENALRIRGAAAQINQEGRYATSRKSDWVRGQDRWDRDKLGQGGSKQSQGPRYKGGYDR